MIGVAKDCQAASQHESGPTSQYAPFLLEKVKVGHHHALGLHGKMGVRRHSRFMTVKGQGGLGQLG